MKRTARTIRSILFTVAIAANVFARGGASIDFTVSGYTGTQTLTNFPVLVRFSTAIKDFDYSQCAPDGRDLTFAIGETELPREIESWDVNGESLVWVRLPELKNGTTFKAYLNDPGVAVQPPCQTDGSVWKPAGYIGVWHMADVNAKDSSASGHDGTLVTANSKNKVVDGRIGSGVYFDRQSIVDCGKGVDPAIGQGFSVEGWRKSNMHNDDRTMLEVTGCFVVKFRTGEFFITTPNIEDHSLGGQTPEDVWCHSVISFIPDQADDGVKAYKDGQFLKQRKASRMNPVTENSRVNLGGNSIWGQYFDGVLDEIRLSKVVPTADWVLGTYQTMADPDFLTSAGLVQGDTSLVVACHPSVDIPGMDPAVGMHNGFTAGRTYDCSVPAGEINLADGVKAYCTGWKVYSYDAESGLFVFDENREKATGSKAAFTYVHPDPALYSKLEWQFVISNRVTSAVNNEALGSTDVSAVWLQSGDTVTITAASKEGGVFSRWIGDIQDNNPTDTAITLKADGPLSVTAVFRSSGKNCWYVAPNGDDENNSGLAADDGFRTINHAVQVAREGDQVFLVEGTHLLSETVTVDKELTITGAGMDKAIVDRVSTEMKTRFFIMNHPKAVLENVTIRNAAHVGKYDEYGSAILIEEQGGILRNSRVTACQAGNLYRRGTIAIRGVEGLVSHCIINNNTNFGGQAGYGGGLFVEAGLAENCLIYGNYAALGGGVRVTGEGMVRNCTIVGNTAYDKGGGVYWEANPQGANAFQNNLVAWNDAVASPGPGGDEWYATDDWHRNRLNEVAANCFFGPTAQAIGTNSLSGDPCFVDPSNNDYTLLTGSPAMDAGAPYEGIASTDLTGNDRVVGGAPDIGCHEFAGEALSCGFSISPIACFEGEKVSFHPVVRNAADGQTFSYDWELKSAEGKTKSFTGDAPTEVIPDAGWYDVTLTVSVGAGATTTLSRSRPLHIAARTNYLASAGSTPVYPWKTPATAANDMETLVDEAIDGSVILLGEGEFALPKEVIVVRDVKMIGAGKDKTVFVRADPDKSMRLFQLGDPDAVLEGVTLKGGRYPGFYNDYGNGILINARGGTLRDSRVTECSQGSLYHRGAIAIRSKDGLVSHCVVDHNSCKDGQGAGIYIENGLAENCLVHDNTCQEGGGVYVSYGGRVRGCTIANNTATETGGGVYWAAGNVPSNSFVNVIVSGNTALNDSGEGAPEWAVNGDWHMERFASTTHHCLFGAAAHSVGADSFLGDAAFTDVPKGDFTLLPGSAAIDRGMVYEGIPEFDLAGNTRIQNDTPDIGCYEFAADKLTCGFTAAPTVLFEGENLTLTPTVFGAKNPSDVSYRWILTSKEGKNLVFDEEAPVKPVPDAGWYDVTLEVTDGPGGARATLTRPGLVHVVARDVYLAPPSEEVVPAYPWKTPATASTNIYDLVAEAVDGVTIHMAEGEYKLTNQVDVICGIKLLGAGMDKTVFVPCSPKMGVRFFYLNHPDALLDGVTLKGAHHGVKYSVFGNAILIGAMGGTFSRSRVTEGYAWSLYHRGMVGVQGAKGLVTRCIIDHNVNSNGNAQAHGNGLALSAGTAENCLVYENEAESFTAGLYVSGAATVRNCTFANNRMLVGPTGDPGAAGVYFCGNADLARIVNCIFAGNVTAEKRALGPGAPEWAVSDLSKTNVFVNCLFSDSALTGTNAVAGDPLFKDAKNGDYKIPRNSPAWNKGVYEDWMADAVDLDGNPRVDHKTEVDIGCYEAPFVPAGTLLLLR